jgi:hypothetical protein
MVQIVNDPLPVDEPSAASGSAVVAHQGARRPHSEGYVTYGTDNEDIRNTTCLEAGIAKPPNRKREMCRRPHAMCEESPPSDARYVSLLLHLAYEPSVDIRNAVRKQSQMTIFRQELSVDIGNCVG